MQRKTKNKAKIISAIVLISLISISLYFPDKVNTLNRKIVSLGNQFASVVLVKDFKTVSEIKSRFLTTKKTDSLRGVRVLIVPGHEPNYGGAEYGYLKERDMNLELAGYLKKYLDSNFRFDTFTTRDKNGWAAEFEEYFSSNADEISKWISLSKDEQERLVSIGEINPSVAQVVHNRAQGDIALRLYGVTKWANENDIDIVIHVHFNDAPRRNAKLPGKFSGFSIYAPAVEYGNSKSSSAIASSIFKALAKFSPVSNLEGEKNGIIFEPNLIAIGSNNTSSAPSVLIEYGYIYERQFQDATIRDAAIKDLAYQTYVGIVNFFEPKFNSTNSYGTTLLPMNKARIETNDSFPTVDVFALQTALIHDGVYPPANKTKNECPRTGMIGDCTRAAISEFNAKRNISGTIVSPMTLNAIANL